jgi:hypothetical protein
VTRFCVKAEKRPKQYIKREKSTFDEKISNFSMDQFSPFYWKKIIISSKTSLDRLKLMCPPPHPTPPPKIDPMHMYARYQHTCGIFRDRKKGMIVVVAGGYRSPGTFSDPNVLDSTEMYILSTRKWITGNNSALRSECAEKCVR